MKVTKTTLVTVLAALCGAAGTAQGQIVNGSFETGDYTGWTLFEGAPGGGGNPLCGIWGIATNGQTINQFDTTFDFFDGVSVQHTFPTNALPTTYVATDGNFVAYQLQNCSQTHRMSQVINVPGGAPELTWDMQYESNVAFVAKSTSPNFAQELAVEIRNLSGTTILATLFTTDPANPTNAGNPLAVSLQGYSADISAFAGQTVLLTVDMQVNINPLAAYFDNFQIMGCEPPEVNCFADPVGEDDDDCLLAVSWDVFFTPDCEGTVVAVIDIGCDVIVVENGQLVELDCEEDDDCGAEYDDDGVLQIEAATATLIITAVDSDGNETICEIDLCAACPNDDDDGDDG